MAIKSYKPTSPSRRQMTVTDYSELSKVAPERASSLLSIRRQEETAMVVSLFVTEAAETEESTESSISREISRA